MVLNRQKRRKPMSEINVVPYIDVMLVLLIIFMITAPLLSQGVKVNLPKAKAQALSAKQKDPIIISVDARGNYYLNTSSNPKNPITSKQLTSTVTAELQLSKNSGHERKVLVKGDREVNYGKVVQAMLLLQHAGASSVGLMTQEPDEK